MQPNPVLPQRLITAKANPLKLPSEIVDLITQRRTVRGKILHTKFTEDKKEYNGLNKIV